MTGHTAGGTLHSGNTLLMTIAAPAAASSLTQDAHAGFLLQMAADTGRGLHSSTFQLNLSHFR